MLSIERHKLIGPGVSYLPTAHVKGRIEPTLIVGHDTACSTLRGAAARYLANNDRGVSAHIVIERDGSITQLADFDRRVEHAGKSSWEGREWCNGWSVGIEIVSPGALKRVGNVGVAWHGKTWPIEQLVEIESAAHGGRYWWLPYSQAQLDAFDAVVKALVMRYPSIVDLAGHFEVSPRRKVDPGPHFPIDEMRKLVRGRGVLREQWPRQIREEVQARLNDLGYHCGAVDGLIGPATREKIGTFQEQNGLEVTRQIDSPTLQALRSDDALPYPTGAREDTTVGDLRAKGSGTLTGTQVTKRTAETAGVGKVFEAVTDPVTGPFAKAEAALDRTEAIKDAGERAWPLLKWLGTAEGISTLFALAILAGIWFAANSIEWARLRDHKSMKNMGR